MRWVFVLLQVDPNPFQKPKGCPYPGCREALSVTLGSSPTSPLFLHGHPGVSGPQAIGRGRQTRNDVR